jgi:hypothetical protein
MYRGLGFSTVEEILCARAGWEVKDIPASIEQIRREQFINALHS